MLVGFPPIKTPSTQLERDQLNCSSPSLVTHIFPPTRSIVDHPNRSTAVYMGRSLLGRIMDLLLPPCPEYVDSPLPHSSQPRSSRPHFSRRRASRSRPHRWVDYGYESFPPLTRREQRRHARQKPRQKTVQWGTVTVIDDEPQGQFTQGPRRSREPDTGTPPSHYPRGIRKSSTRLDREMYYINMRRMVNMAERCLDLNHRCFEEGLGEYFLDQIFRLEELYMRQEVQSRNPPSRRHQKVSEKEWLGADAH